MDELNTTYLAELHHNMGAKMVAFAGYAMPMQYPQGIVKEHQHTRNGAGLFDVSHMGKLMIRGMNGAAAIERLVGADIQGMEAGRWCYTQILNQNGGIEDDILVGKDPENPEQILHLVVNAARASHDIHLIEESLHEEKELELIIEKNYCLLALQGPLAAAVLDGIDDKISQIGWMHSQYIDFEGGRLFVSRSGYTGNDGFEILVDHALADTLVARLTESEKVMWCGLGARNTLRLEAGLCLYGHDLDAETTPIEAQLRWSLSQKRIQSGSYFQGIDTIKGQIENGTEKQRAGFMLSGRAIARDGALIYNDEGSKVVGRVTSGAFSPTLKRGIAMGYIPTVLAKEGKVLLCEIRGEMQQAQVVSLPFIKDLREQAESFKKPSSLRRY